MITNLFRVSAAILLFALASLPAAAQAPTKPKFKVKITDDKTVVVDMEDSGLVDPTRRINFEGNAFQQRGFYVTIRTINNQNLHLSHFPSFQINGRIFQAGQGGRFEATKKLPDGPGGKKRVGHFTVCTIEGVKITQTLELHPSKAAGPGKKRLMNNVLVSYHIENQGKRAVNLAVRNYMDTYVIDNDGCLFAAPVTHPGKILDGVELKGKTLPPYLQMLQRPDLKNPLFMSYLTLNVGSKFEKANKLVCTRLGAGFGGWDVPAVPAMGDSAVAMFWPTKELSPGGKRDVAYVYGEGIATAAESEGRFQLSLNGNFEPGKSFTISAVVADPASGQTLSLDLPAGMKRLEGKQVQPVAALADGQEYAAVMWRVRVTSPGEHTIRIRSSTGVTQTKIVSITAAK